MIPKVIHYCWFGRGEKSRLIKKCIRSWKKYCPDYEIIEWNEDNFDINSTTWTREAYEAKKWAFVSDYVRLWVLYNYGGIYLDTDMEVKRPIDEFLRFEAFTGVENSTSITSAILGAQKNCPIIEKWLSYYNDKNYVVDGNPILDPNVNFMTDMLVEFGYKLNNEYQVVCGLSVFPKTYFCPIGMLSVDEDCISKNTYTIHHFTSSWRTTKAKKDMKRVKRHSTWWYKAYEQVAAYPIAAYKKLFGRKK